MTNTQQLFFDSQPPQIPGLTIVDEWLNSGPQAQLLDWIDAQTWSSQLRRRVQHFGFRYDYTARTVSRSDYLGPLPSRLQTLADRLVQEGWFDAVPNQAIVNEYEPGQGIAPHIDCVPCFGPVIASVSLGSSIVMDFSGVAESHEEVVLAAGSLLVLSEAARYEWRHGIAKRLTDRISGARARRGRRVSVTFRTVRLDVP